ncbi:tRNA pseudouridine(55) synthase TruB [Bordetella petrii]|uniref:tRNA pseudouridine(55) synthase TruB n=1 Tax=Bordetella petrii TaxID=94624 RepID=UPI001E4A4E91|nr:tRNA pseudouridine(55) synthase TruB [Bordetella petrii]MCD0505107.1 tRNA pseudouridine(55) synthase TruB [Bordetella petrii]
MAKRRGLALDGVLLLDKPVGLSSNHALQRAKRSMDAAKAGHTGTLDPFATGLLVCCMGRATKISGAMLEADKAYRATLQFGEETDSGDLTGNVVATADGGCQVTEAALRDALSRFQGIIEQVPPMYSALKRDGKPLYEYARQGIELERPPRQVTIHRIDLLSLEGTRAEIDVACSKGTYIRTLAQDIGRALGCYAHLAALRRTHVGPFSLDRAVTLEALQAMTDPKQALLALTELPAGLLPATQTLKDPL